MTQFPQSNQMYRFKSCADAETNVLVSVYQDSVKQKDCGTLLLTYGLDQSDQIYHINCGARGDMIKFSKTSINLIVFEVVTLGTAAGKKARKNVLILRKASIYI